MQMITRKQYFRNNRYPLVTAIMGVFGSIALIVGYVGAAHDKWWIPAAIFYAAAIVTQIAGRVAYWRYVRGEKVQKVDKLKMREQ